MKTLVRDRHSTAPDACSWRVAEAGNPQQPLACNWPASTYAHDRADAWSNGKMLCIISRPGGFNTLTVGRTRQAHFGPSVRNSPLGAAVKKALDHSLVLTRKVLEKSSSEQGRKERRLEQLQRLISLMERYHYKTARAFFLHMQHCSIGRSGDRIQIAPSEHDQMDGWRSLPSKFTLFLAAESSNEQIGAALLLAFSRCIDSYGKKHG
jgi:hypothetical protein